MKIFKSFKFAFLIAFAIQLMLLSGCLNGKLVWADNSVTQTPNIDVKVLETSKKQFILGEDADSLVAQFSKYGELTCLNVEVSGETTIEKLKKTTTGMQTDSNGIGQVSKNQAESDYFTDLIKVKIYLPKNAIYVNFADKREDVAIDKATMTEDTYLKQNYEFIRLNKAKTEASVVTNTENGIYYFVCFKDQNKEILEKYFLHITYRVSIK